MTRWLTLLTKPTLLLSYSFESSKKESLPFVKCLSNYYAMLMQSDWPWWWLSIVYNLPFSHILLSMRTMRHMAPKCLTNMTPMPWPTGTQLSLKTAIDAKIPVFLQGIMFTQKAINVYCSIHRLLLALANHYQLWDEAAARLEAFILHETNRNKVSVSLSDCHPRSFSIAKAQQ